MSSGDEARRLSSQDLQLVQNLIEQCIQLHMSKNDAVTMLLRDARIQPSITELVWQRLEEENREFFNVYYIRLALKDQIKMFNELLKKQAELMQRAALMPVSNGCRMAQFQQNAGCYSIDQTGPSVRPDSLQPSMAPGLHYTNGGASTLQTPTTFGLSTPSRSNDFLSNTLDVQSSNSMRLMQGLNGGTIKTESVYPSESQIIFDTDGNVVETHSPMEDASVAAFSHLEANSQGLLGMDPSSFAHLGQIPKNFSFPDLSAYPHLLDNYPSSAFVSTDADNFLDHHDRVDITDENKKLETLSESYSVEDFGGSD